MTEQNKISQRSGEKEDGPSAASLVSARDQLVSALAGARDKLHDSTGLRLERSWVAPVAAGAAGLALALWLRRRKRQRS